ADIGDDWEHDANRAKLIRWYWNGVFGELYGSAVETRIARDFIEVPSWLKGGPEPSTVTETIFRADPPEDYSYAPIRRQQGHECPSYERRNPGLPLRPEVRSHRVLRGECGYSSHFSSGLVQAARN